MKNNFILSSIFLIVSCLLPSCTTEDTLAKLTLGTTEISILTEAAASFTSLIRSNGGASISERGVCWSTTPNPTIENDRTSDESETAYFTSLITGLTPSTTYYVRSFAINKVDTAYSPQVSFKTIELASDLDGNRYNTVIIGNQVWMVQNLKTTKYRDGTSIPNVTDPTQWSNMSTGAYCDYDNRTSDSTTYGFLYNWYAVNNSRKIAPTGWHIATAAEWDALISFLGGGLAGDKLKETGDVHWKSPNARSTNESGFTALPGGSRSSDGVFASIGYVGNWWSATEASTSTAWGTNLGRNGSSVSRESGAKACGFSVRCLRDM